MKRTGVFLSILLLSLLAGCGGGSQRATATPFPIPSRAPTEPPTITPTLGPTATITPSPTPVSARVTVPSANLRLGPGTADAILGQYDQTTVFVASGAAPGRQWVYVTAPDGQTGWLYAELLNLGDALADLPTREPVNSYLVRGTITQSGGEPIPGVRVRVFRTEGDTEIQTIATTTEDGSFYLYLPIDETGSWTVEITGVECSSPITDNLCHYDGTFEVQGSATLTLPQQDWVVFVYTANP